MTDNTERAASVPLVEQLRSIPRDAKLSIDTPNALGCMDTRSIPVGRICHEAADALALPVRDLTDDEIDEVYELPRAHSAFIYQARDLLRKFREVNGLRIGLPVREGMSDERWVCTECGEVPVDNLLFSAAHDGSKGGCGMRCVRVGREAALRTAGAAGPVGDAGVMSPAPNPCKLTECQGKPRCRPCAAMDRAYGVVGVSRG